MLFKATFELPPVLLLPAVHGRQEYTQMILPFVDPNGHKPGVPDVPVVHRLLAIPRGVLVRVAAINVDRSQHLDGVLLYPSQPQAADVALTQRNDGPPPGIFEDPDFVMDADAYRSDKSFPEKWVDVMPMGRMRDLDIVLLSQHGLRRQRRHGPRLQPDGQRRHHARPGLRAHPGRYAGAGAAGDRQDRRLRGHAALRRFLLQ